MSRNARTHTGTTKANAALALGMICMLIIVSPAFAQEIITTVAGNGSASFSGDGGPSSFASLNHPRGLAVDASGNLYISDSDNWRVRRVTPSGMISTVAGNGFYGSAGDGGAASSAAFSDVQDVALDASGNLYIADATNRRIRKVAPNGTVTTVAGTGLEGFSGDGGLATAAMIGRPTGLALDAAGNLYFTDSTAQRIRRIGVNGIITTVAGNGLAGFSGDGLLAINASMQFPLGLAIDGSGNIYFADGDNHRVRKISPGGVIITVAGNGFAGAAGDNGPATLASLNIPADVALDSAGNLYIADAGNNRIRKVTPAGTITTVAGIGVDGFSGDGGAAAQAMLNFPWALTSDSAGTVYVADRVNNRVRKISGSGSSTTPTPRLSSNAIVNAATFTNVAIAPGSLVALFGSDFAASASQAASVPLPTVLGETSVTFNGVAAPLLYVGPGQINVQAPFDLPTGVASVQVRRGTSVSTTQTAAVGSFSPGIFIVDQSNNTGAILHADNFALVNSSAAARAGEFLLIYGTGFGSLRIPVRSGERAPSSPPLAETNTVPSVTIGGLPATVSFSGLAPGFVGLYQINVMVPAGLFAGNHPVRITMNGATSNTATMAVR